MENEKIIKQAIDKEKEEEKKKEKKKPHQIPPYLKPISALVAKMKEQKFGSKDIKPIKYKAVISPPYFQNNYYTIFFFLR